MLTLLLSRKRRVKVLETKGDRLVVSVPGDEEDAVVEIAVPTIDAEAAETIQRQLAELFGFAPPEAADSPAEA